MRLNFLIFLFIFIFFCVSSGFVKGEGVYHTVEKGQTLWRIAKTYNVPLDDIIAANKIEDVTNIKIGQKIFIPGAKRVLSVIPYQTKEEILKEGVYHIVGAGETLWRIARTYGVALGEILAVNKIVDVTNIEIGRKIFIPGANKTLKVEVYRPLEISGERPEFIWPVEGKIISKFGPRGSSFHKAIDIGSSYGAPIYAAATGTVTTSQTMQGYGNVIIVAHDYNFVTVYAHNSVNLVEKGQQVKKGEIIAQVGMTGRATTPHLHFEIREKGVAKDPLLYLPRR